MKRFSIGLALVAFGLFSALTGQSQTASETGDSLRKLAAEFWTWRASTQPYSPDDIPRIERPGGKRDWSKAAIKRERETLAQFESRWQKLATPYAPLSQQVDYKLMGSALARVRWELDWNSRWKRDPNFYVEQSLTAVVEALVVPPGFDQARSQELLLRIRSIPQIVRDGEANLEDPPKPFVAVAIDSLDGIGKKLTGMTPSLAPVTTLAPEELASALEAAGTALEGYRTWLQKKLPGSPAKTGLGGEAYLYFLRNVALLPYTPEQLLELSRQEWARTVAFEVLEQGRNQKVPPLTIFPDRAAWIQKAREEELAIREFLVANHILTVPLDMHHYTLKPMPDYLRAVGAFGETDDFTGPSRLNEDSTRYVNPPSDQMGFFWLATAEDPRPITVHEGVPGHYFQLSVSWRNPDPIRRHYYDSGANEGIGFYAEEMLLQAGLFDDSPHTREIIYHFMRLRALRVEVDVKLALGQFTLEQAAAYLESKVPMDRETAMAEATMFATSPGQAISYQVGKAQILEFLAEARLRQGENFDLRKFHDFLWSNGNVPIALQRDEYLAVE